MTSKLALLVVSACGTALAGPVVVYDSFGLGNTYITPGITFGCGATCWHDGGHTIALAFVPSSTVALTEIDTAAWWLSSPTNIVLSVAADSGDLPGTLLESFSASLSAAPAMMQMGSALNPVLNGGSRYWLVFDVPDPVNESGMLAVSPLPGAVEEAYKIGGGPWMSGMASSQGAFRISGEAMPEPSSAVLMATALTAILAARLGRKRPSSR